MKTMTPEGRFLVATAALGVGVVGAAVLIRASHGRGSRLRGTDADVHREVTAAKRARDTVVTRASRRFNVAKREAFRVFGSTDVEQAARSNAIARAERDRDAVTAAAETRYQKRLADIRQNAGEWSSLVPLRGSRSRYLPVGHKGGKVPGPRLQALLDAGTIKLDGHEYVGTAADGVEVSIGEADETRRIESYLAENPTPDKW